MSAATAGQLGIDGSEVRDTRRILGVDLSTTAAGVSDGHTWADVIKPGKGWPIHNRIEHIREAIRDLTRSAFVAFAVIEGLAFAAPDRDRQNAGLSWIIRHDLMRHGVPFALVPPANLKVYLTDDGGASKKEMVAAARELAPGVEIVDDNAADAFGLALMGRDAWGMTLVGEPPQARRFEQLAKVTWPERVPA